MTPALLGLALLLGVTAWAIFEWTLTERTLTNLRANCFIPDERGVKVRYSEASDARRAKAESVKEV